MVSEISLEQLRAEHQTALDNLQLARANLERAQIELKHFEKVASAKGAWLKRAMKAANGKVSSIDARRSPRE